MNWISFCVLSKGIMDICILKNSSNVRIIADHWIRAIYGYQIIRWWTIKSANPWYIAYIDIYCILHCINANKKNCPPNQWFIYYDLMGQSIWWSCDRKLHLAEHKLDDLLRFGWVELSFVDEWIWFTFTAKLQCIVICGFSSMKWHYKIYRNHSTAPLNPQYFRDYGPQRLATDLMERF